MHAAMTKMTKPAVLLAASLLASVGLAGPGVDPLAADIHASAGTPAAAATLAARWTGSWGSADSLYAGTTEQTELHLAADGVGFMVGSTKPFVRMDGGPTPQPAPRATIGFGVRATVDGDVLVLAPFLPGQAVTEAMRRMTVTCRYVDNGPALQCAAPTGTAAVLKRREDAMSAEVVDMIEAIRANAPHTR